jgi:hypothetical protein
MSSKYTVKKIARFVGSVEATGVNEIGDREPRMTPGLRPCRLTLAP